MARLSLPTLVSTAQGQLGYIYDTMSVEPVPSAKTHANNEYAPRINRVIDYLRGNLDRQVKLKELARVACLSEFHYRIFGAVSGETLNNFTNRLRLEKAARLLRYSGQSMTDIALDCGFSSSATFSRAFRSGYDTSPVSFEKAARSKKARFAKNSSQKMNMVCPTLHKLFLNICWKSFAQNDLEIKQQTL